MPHCQTTTYLKEALTVAIGQLLNDDSSCGVGKSSKYLIHTRIICN
jgi:hypothetical protein